MRVTTTLDLHENKEYYAQLVKGGKIRKIRLLGIINSNSRTEVCFQVIDKNLRYLESYNFYSIHEIGIGAYEYEASQNYGKLIDSKSPPIYNSDEEITCWLKRIETAPRRYEYFNYRNVKSEPILE